MSEEQKPARRRGRPPGKRGTFAFRVTSTLRAQLEAAAAQSGKPISEEIELRLEKSFWLEDAANNANFAESRVREIVNSVLDERADKHNRSVRFGGTTSINVQGRPDDTWLA